MSSLSISLKGTFLRFYATVVDAHLNYAILAWPPPDPSFIIFRTRRIADIIRARAADAKKQGWVTCSSIECVSKVPKHAKDNH